MAGPREEFRILQTLFEVPRSKETRDRAVLPPDTQQTPRCQNVPELSIRTVPYLRLGGLSSWSAGCSLAYFLEPIHICELKG